MDYQEREKEEETRIVEDMGESSADLPAESQTDVSHETERRARTEEELIRAITESAEGKELQRELDARGPYLSQSQGWFLIGVYLVARLYELPVAGATARDVELMNLSAAL